MIVQLQQPHNNPIGVYVRHPCYRLGAWEDQRDDLQICLKMICQILQRPREIAKYRFHEKGLYDQENLFYFYAANYFVRCRGGIPQACVLLTQECVESW